ncbi:hypothetical protein ACRAVF_19270 [Bradyrhizobium oligotrophicum S58]
MTPMRSNMTTTEFVEWLRSAAIVGQMPPQFIALVDDLDADLGAHDALELMEQRAADAEEMLDDLVTACRKGKPRGGIVDAAELLLKSVP